jgi:hypothetical protein
MKTPEDEAFDELARKQGAWGGGFTAKRQAAMDKINSEFHEEYIKYRTAFPKEYTAPQPAQEPVGYVYSEAGVKHGAIQRDLPNGTPLYAAPPQRERVLFPTMLRKMWSGGEVQAWLDENVNKEKNNGT